MSATADAVYELTAARRGLVMNRGKLTENEARYNALPEVPDTYRPFIGNCADVSKEAGRRNEIQVHHGFMDYLYAPEPQGAKPSEVDAETVDAAIKAMEARK